jgi:hypothetical protein
MTRIQAGPSAELVAYSDPLHDFLRHCDLAKFARCLLTVAQMKLMHQSAWDFVDRTRPRPVEKPDPKAAKTAEACSEVSPVSGRPPFRERIRALFHHGIFKKATAGVEFGADSAVAAGGQ